MLFADLKFRNRLLFTLLLVLVPVMLIGSAVGYLQFKYVLDKSIEHHLNASLDSLIRLIHLTDSGNAPKFILAFTTKDSGFAFAMDEQGTMIVHPHYPQGTRIPQIKEGKEPFREMVRAKNGKITFQCRTPQEQKPREKMAVYRYLPDKKWIVVICCDLKRAHMPLKVFSGSLIGILVFCLFAIGAGLFIISRHITRPLESMMSTLVEIGKGDRSARMKEQGPKEFATLSRHFNAVMKTLEKNDQEIKDEIRKNEASKTALVENDLKLRSLFDQSFQYIGILSPTGVLEQINKSVLDFAGCRPEDVLFRPFWEAGWWQHDPEVVKQLEQGVHKAMEGEFVRYETTSISKEGKIRNIDISIKPVLQDDNEIVFIIAEGRDITRYKRTSRDRKNLAIQLERAQKMEALGTLAGGIAHDFNNILSGILGHAQLLEMAKNSAVGVEDHIEHIVKGVRRAADLTQQILTFSRRTDYEKQPLELRIVVKEVLKLMRSSIPVTIEIKSRIESHSMILADATQMHQMIMNLCTNAYHAMLPDGGELYVSLVDEFFPGSHDVFGHPFPGGHYLELEIRDTGHGMDDETLAKSFDPYFTTKDEGKGTGLGLALVHAIVEDHCGYIQVKTREEIGSHFYVRIPVTDSTTAAIQAVKKEKQALLKGNERIMVVDDEAAIRKVIKRFLENLGYKVTCFDNAVEALAAFESDISAFDLVVTDMTMPKMTGDHLAQKLLALRPELPIILCTGYSETVSEERLLSIGVKRFALKPVDNADLSAWIRELLDHPA